MSKRVEHFQQWLKEENIDVSLLTSTENVFILVNFIQIPMKGY